MTAGPRPDWSGPDEAGDPPLSDGVLDRVIRIWADVLGLPRIGPDDNVFQLGAQSLTAVRAVNRLREEFQVRVPLRLLFEAPTAAELAAHLSGAPGDGDRP